MGTIMIAQFSDPLAHVDALADARGARAWHQRQQRQRAAAVGAGHLGGAHEEGGQEAGGRCGALGKWGKKGLVKMWRCGVWARMKKVDRKPGKVRRGLRKKYIVSVMTKEVTGEGERP